MGAKTLNKHKEVIMIRIRTVIASWGSGVGTGRGPMGEWNRRGHRSHISTRSSYNVVCFTIMKLYMCSV